MSLVAPVGDFNINPTGILSVVKAERIRDDESSDFCRIVKMLIVDKKNKVSYLDRNSPYSILLQYNKPWSRFIIKVVGRYSQIWRPLLAYDYQNTP